ncbi:MAG TPA: hypothetical protein VJ919_13410 [Tangfeifania sp.]|nr:hypothetical protein [Tangfeifania sp.]
MKESVKIKNIVNQVSTLDYNSKVQVAEKIISLLRKKSNNKSQAQKLTDLKGLGADLWNSIDVDDYLQNERAWD